ncbi:MULTISPECIES: hypothetical protein [unclassified Nostoc]|uniref:hypothetical protein n=1 Tax=unclassified Nostoc TaxID=2593658 RepID=UPI00262AE89E|nr:hypothetical protein [Nostoc sp. S13]MDF5734188.1 hypothetical protein [Nostoc sp. S13]
MAVGQQLIDLWVQRQQQSSANITLLCSLEDGGFLPQAHRWAGDYWAIPLAHFSFRDAPRM